MYHNIGTSVRLPQSAMIELSWEYENDSTLFNVYRNGSIIAPHVNEKQYSDTDVEVDVDYCYHIKATNEVIESVASEEVCALIIGIEEYTNNFKVYPNPTHSIINIEGEGIEKISVLNAMGQIVKVVTVMNEIISINVSNFAAGNYIINVSFLDGSTGTAKIIVQ
jgi:hypothetical protein